MTPEHSPLRHERPLAISGTKGIRLRAPLVYARPGPRLVYARPLFGSIVLLLCACIAQACVGSTETESSSGCVVGEITYELGEPMQSDDCNSCTCTENGPLCTAVGCAVGCEFRGAYYDFGEFVADDGCLACDCLGTGEVYCLSVGCYDGCWYQEEYYGFGETFACEIADCGPTCECGKWGDVTCVPLGS